MNAISNILVASPDSDTLGGRLVRARETRGLSTAALANQLGVKKETVAAWERDRSEPRINRLVMLAGILGVSPTWLMSGHGAGLPDEDEMAAPAATQPEALAFALQELRRLQTETGRVIARLEDQMRGPLGA